MSDVVRCCWTHCHNPQGSGTWTDIDDHLLPVCEEHWFGNIDQERRRLRADLEGMKELLRDTQSFFDVWRGTAAPDGQMMALLARIDQALDNEGKRT